MSGAKYDSIKIHVLKKSEYTTWKVKMTMYLESVDPDYLDMINVGPFILTKSVAATPEKPEHLINKPKSEWIPEERALVRKDAKVRNIFHNSLDSVLSNRSIACKTAKDIWDALTVQCQGTESIKKNRRDILIQE